MAKIMTLCPLKLILVTWEIYKQSNMLNIEIYMHTTNYRSSIVKEYKISPLVEEGDVIGFSYDHVELNIYCNGKNLDTPVLGIKGTVFPVFYGRPLTILIYIYK